MNTKTEQSPENAYLTRLSRLVATVSEHIITENLLPKTPQWPQWVLPEEQRRGTVRRWLHRIYSAQDDWIISLPPVRFSLFLGLILSLVMEPFWPAAYPLVSYVLSFAPWHWNCKVIGVLLFLVLLLALTLFVPVVSAVGAYWTLFALMINQRLKLIVKLLVISLIAIGIVIWLTIGGAGRPSDMWQQTTGLSGVALHLQQAIISIQTSSVYRLVSVFLFFIPAISYSVLGVIRQVLVFMLSAALMRKWLFRLQTTEPVNALTKLLSTPLPLIDGGGSRTLLELEKADIDALYDIALCRRRVIQNRLLPTTLMLAFLAILANTSLGESAVKTAIAILKDFSSLGELAVKTAIALLTIAITKNYPGDPWLILNQFIIALAEVIFLVFLVLLPVVFIGSLLTEAFIMDYITQACVWARHAKLYSHRLSDQEQVLANRQTPKAHGLLGRLRSWFF